MITYGSGVVLGADSFLEAIRNLPGRVAKRVMDRWTLEQARKLRDLAKRMAPRDRNPKRKKPESARLWRALRASPVRRLRNKSIVSRSIVYAVKAERGGRAVRRVNKNIASRVKRGKTGVRRTTPITSGDLVSRARHFHLVLRGNPKTRPRRHKSGKSTGNMTTNTTWWDTAARVVLAQAKGEVGAKLRDAYIAQLDAEMKRMTRKYL